MKRMRRTLLVMTTAIGLAVGLTACESLLVKLNGGNNSAVDWKVGIRF